MPHPHPLRPSLLAALVVLPVVTLAWPHAVSSAPPPPSAPTNLRVTATTTSTIAVAWNASIHRGVVGYGMYRNGTRVAQVQTTSYSHSSLPCGTSYRLGVDAYDKHGSRSATVSITASTSECTTTSPPPSSTSDWPASYFTGPLGSRNILPASRGGALVTMRSPSQSVLEARESYAGRRLDLVSLHFGGGGTYNGIANCAYTNGTALIDWAQSRGQPAYLSWTPNRSTTNSLLRDINEGRKDACLRAVADLLGRYKIRIMLRPMWEFDQGIYGRKADGTCDYAECGKGQPFIDAWRRIVNIFHGEGRAPNVGFFWCPIEAFDRDYQDKSYPGDAYVDWVGADRYNWAKGWVTPLHAGWAEFWEMVNYPLTSGGSSLYSRYASRKPYFIGETSTKFDANDVHRKGNWYRAIAKAKDPLDLTRYMPNLIGVSTFDFYLANEGHDWRMDRNQTADSTAEGAYSTESYAGWRDWVRDPRWNVGVAP